MKVPIVGSQFLCQFVNHHVGSHRAISLSLASDFNRFVAVSAPWHFFPFVEAIAKSPGQVIQYPFHMGSGVFDYIQGAAVA